MKITLIDIVTDQLTSIYDEEYGKKRGAFFRKIL